MRQRKRPRCLKGWPKSRFRGQRLAAHHGFTQSYPNPASVQPNISFATGCGRELVSVQATVAAPVNETEDISEVNEKTDTGDAKEKFVWRDHWYYVSLIEDLDPSMPTPFQLLGMELVLWNDQGKWRAFSDECPHQLAPISLHETGTKGHKRINGSIVVDLTAIDLVETSNIPDDKQKVVVQVAIEDY